jgi:hypothetical protein
MLRILLFFIGICSKTEVFEQLYWDIYKRSQYKAPYLLIVSGTLWHKKTSNSSSIRCKRTSSS